MCHVLPTPEGNHGPWLTEIYLATVAFNAEGEPVPHGKISPVAPESEIFGNQHPCIERVYIGNGLKDVDGAHWDG